MAARFLIMQSRSLAIRSAITQAMGNISLDLIWQQADCLVFATPETATAQSKDAKLLVLGRLFSKADFQPVVLGDRGVGEAQLRCALPDLIDTCWGQYVALVNGEDGIEILRDPSGGLPCYHCWSDEFYAAASDASLLVAARLLRPSVNYDYIRYQFRHPNQRSAATGLDGLKELLPGFVLDWRSVQPVETSAWSPWDHVGYFPGDLDQAGARLREIVDKCTKALARASGDAPLIGVSGGLDSSIIASALRETEFNAKGLSIATTHPDGDERAYAHQVCGRLGLPFQGALYDVTHVDPLRPSAAHLSRPIGEPFLQGYDRIVRQFAQTSGKQILFRGNGGDAVFCFMQNVTPLLDCWETGADAMRLIKTLKDVCKITDSSVQTVLSVAIRKRRESPVASAEVIDDRFLGPVHLSGESFDAHPWFDVPAGIARGRALHILWMTRVLRYTEGYARNDDLELICPLLSQPIVEFCLSVPSWLWVAGGVNRAVARHGYRQILGDETVCRVRKGGPAAFCVDLLETYRRQYRALLLDGLLADHDVIDREAVAAFLNYEGPQRGSDYLRVLALADAEAWARHWSGAGMWPAPRSGPVDPAI